MNLEATTIGFGIRQGTTEMTYLYCYDDKKDYCFSLVRVPDSDKIEVMVLDQLNDKVNDVNLTLTRGSLLAHFEKDVAIKLDNILSYTVYFNLSDEKYFELKKVLEVIFEDKSGFQIDSDI